VLSRQTESFKVKFKKKGKNTVKFEKKNKSLSHDTESSDEDVIIISSSGSSSSDSQTSSSSSIVCLTPASPAPTPEAAKAENRSSSSNSPVLNANQISQMIDCSGKRLSSPEMEHQFSQGNIHSQSLVQYAADFRSSNIREKPLTKANVRNMGLSLFEGQKMGCLFPKSIIIAKDLHAPDISIMFGKSSSCSNKIGSSPLPSDGSDGKEDRNKTDMRAKNPLQGHDCSSSSSKKEHNNKSAAAATTTTSSSQSGVCHDSGSERPAPAADAAAQSTAASHGETLLLIPKSASKAGAAISGLISSEKTPTRSGKRAMSFPDKGDAAACSGGMSGPHHQHQQRELQKSHLTSHYFRSGSQKRKESPLSQRQEEEKRRTHPKVIITTVSVPSQSSAYFTQQHNNGVKRQSQAASQMTGSGFVSPVSSCPWRLPIVRSADRSFSARTESWVKNPAERRRCMSGPPAGSIRLRAGRQPLNESTNVRGIPAIKYAKLQSQSMYSVMNRQKHHPVSPATLASASASSPSPFAHRLPIRKRISDDEEVAEDTP
jgi:hypothetical protein